MLPTLELLSVTRQYGTLTAVDDVSLNLPRGSFLG